MLRTLFSTTLLLLLILLFLLYYYSIRKFNYWKKRKVSYLKPFPFVGNFLPVFLTRKSLNDWSHELYNNIVGDYFGVFIFDQPHLIIKAPELIKDVLIRDFSHFQNREVYVDEKDELLKHALFFSKNPGWKELRSKVSPVYTSGKLKRMFPLIVDESKDMVNYLKKLNQPTKTLEFKEICGKYSTNVIAKCAFAIDAGCFKSEDAKFRNITRKFFDFRISTAMRQMSAFFLPDLVKIFKFSFFDPSVIDEVHSIFSTVLKTRNNVVNLAGNDLVDLLLEIRRKNTKEEFSDNMLMAQALQFFIAGFETVGSTIAFAIYELCLAQEIQAKLRNEIKSTLTEPADFTYEAVNDMQYLDMVVCETLRKYPVLPFLDRRCNDDYTLPGTSLTIEKNTPILISIFGLHYDKKYFPDPERFDPERFEDKSKINKNGIYYLPFGAGPRICIGERFGLLGVKVALISLISNFKFEKTEDTPFPMIFEPKSLLLQSTVGIPVRVVPLTV